MIRARVLLLALACGACVSTAEAQQVRPRRPSAFELDAGVLIAGGSSFGSPSANLTQPAGTPLALFNSSSRADASTGLLLRLGRRMFGGLSLEAEGSWSRQTLQTRVTGDFEGAPDVTAQDRASVYAVEGGAVWTFRRGHRIQPFVHGSAGWTRQLASDNALAEDGTIGRIGGGIKYLWRARGASPGVRVDVDAVLRPSGLLLGLRETRVSPGLAVAALFRF